MIPVLKMVYFLSNGSVYLPTNTVYTDGIIDLTLYNALNQGFSELRTNFFFMRHQTGNYWLLINHDY